MRQKADRESGQSLIEVMVAIGIMAIIGTIMSQWMIVAQKNSLQIEEQAKGIQILAHAMKKVQKSINIRGNTTVYPTIGPKSLTLLVPVSSTSLSTYSLTIKTGCRDLSGFDMMADIAAGPMQTCLSSFACGLGKVPYIEWLRDGSTVEEQPVKAVFDADTKKAFSTVGYGLCFSDAGGTLKITGVLVSSEMVGGSRKAKVKLQSLTVPISKRNGVDMVPQ